MHFNSHAHVERDRTGICFTDVAQISTHTLTWSVTTVSFVIPFGLPISTHTLTWSVTFIGSYSGFKLTISTHTLTWSVTIVETNAFISPKISTHTLTWSVTKSSTLSPIRPIFQLTRSRGAWRLLFSILTTFTNNFNSHAHVERDANPRVTSIYNPISTHTLTWSVTLDVVYIWCLLNVMRTYFFI